MKNFTFYVEHTIEAENVHEALEELQEHLDAGNLDCDKAGDWLLEKQEVLPPKKRNPLIDPLNHCLTILIDIQNGFPEKEFFRPIEEVIEEAKKAIDHFIYG